MEHFQNKIEEGLKSFCDELPKNPEELYQPISYTLSLGGKRIRPLLVLMGCDLFDGQIEKALPAALAIEVFHNFTLLHDDLMDLAPLRRNQPTVYKKWNNNIAILAGDAMFVKSYELIARCHTDKLAEILNVFSATALGVCEGQQYDMNYESTTAVSIEEYIKMIELKTAVLLAGGLKIGAIIGESGEKNANNIYEFGRNIGIAFQLQDDLLDVYGDPGKFGKQIGGDIISNKKTFLLLKALELANTEQREMLLAPVNKDNITGEEKITNVTSIYNELKIKEYTEREMQLFFEKGLGYFNDIDADKSKKQNIELLIENLMKREN